MCQESEIILGCDVALVPFVRLFSDLGVKSISTKERLVSDLC